MPGTTMMWIVFALLLVVMLTVDLGLNRKSHAVSFREALVWSCVWVTLALLFNLGIYYTLGSQKALESFAGYVVEKALSVDNLFVFLMIFSAFAVRAEHQTRILKWGILGALVMRGVFIFVGIELLQNFHWLFYFFGALLIVTAVKMLRNSDDAPAPEKSWLIRIARRLLPVTRRVRGDWFFKRKRGLLVASPLFLVLLLVESSDVVFALDSIPAIFAITLDPFIVFTSNIFAIMGLRSLYFLLAGSMVLFIYLKYGIALILAFIGGKMLALAAGVHVPITVSLTVILSCLLLSILASLFLRRLPSLQPCSDETNSD